MWPKAGRLEWHETGRPVVQLAEDRFAWFVDESELNVESGRSIPEWINGKDLNEIDRRAATELAKHLTVAQPLELSLTQLANHRQVEVRSLAFRALCYLDMFEPALESFRNEINKFYWSKHLDSLRSRMTNGAETATKLRAAVDKVFPDESAMINKLLNGYSTDELAMGGAAELVDGLSNSSMPIRVLSFENLRRITDKTLLYRPEESPDQPASKIARWRKLLDEGGIIYKAAPSIRDSFQ
jgi:hypothetical protein